MSVVTLSMRYKKQSNNGVGFKKDIDESLQTLKAYGYIFSPGQARHISYHSHCDVVISDPVRKRRAVGVINNLVPTKLSLSGKQRYEIEFLYLQEVSFLDENFSKHRTGVKVHNATGSEIK
jgi:hypothetical protein